MQTGALCQNAGEVGGLPTAVVAPSKMGPLELQPFAAALAHFELFPLFIVLFVLS